MSQAELIDQRSWARWRIADLALEQGRINLAFRLFSNLMDDFETLSPELKCDVVVGLGRVLAAKGRHKEALRVWQSLLGNPNGFGSPFYKPQLVLAWVSESMPFINENGYLNVASLAVQIAEKRESGLSVAYRAKGVALFRLAEIDQAIGHLSLAIESACEERHLLNGASAAGALANVFEADPRYSQTSTPLRSLVKMILLNEAPGSLAEVLEKAPDLNGSEPMPPACVRLKEVLQQQRRRRTHDGLSLADVDLYECCRAYSSSEETFHAWIVVPEDEEERLVRAALLVDETITVLVTPDVLSTIRDSFVAGRFGVRKAIENAPPLVPDSDFLDLVPDGAGRHKLVWNSSTPWPHAFGLALSVASKLGWMGKEHIRRKYLEGGLPEWTEMLLNTTRILPRSMHTRHFGFGEWLAGHSDFPPDMAEALLRRGLNDDRLNEMNLAKIGYDSRISEQYSAGGILGLPAATLEPRGGFPNSVGAMIANEWNVANLPGIEVLASDPKERLLGFLVDSHYQTLFSARKHGAHGLYGPRVVFRDHFKAFRESVNVVGHTRIKHYCAPVIEASGMGELRALVERFREMHGDDCYFRGQSRHFRLDRPAEVQEILYGAVNVDEPSFPGAAQRLNLDYNETHGVFRLLLQDYVYAQGYAAGKDLSELHSSWKEVAGSVRLDYEAMALAQHYGIPTHGLDVTKSLDVAIWFATQTWAETNGRSRSTQRELSSWPKECEKWPVVYIVRPSSDSVRGIASIQGVEELKLTALRPIRQSASLFMGADSIHRNRLAEAIVCVLRLGPSDWSTGLTFDYMFPSPTDDPFHAFMSALRERFKNGRLGAYFSRIHNFDYGVD